MTRPTYSALVRLLERTLEMIREMAADIAVPGRIRFRLMKWAKRIETALKAAKED